MKAISIGRKGWHPHYFAKWYRLLSLLAMHAANLDPGFGSSDYGGPGRYYLGGWWTLRTEHEPSARKGKCWRTKLLTPSSLTFLPFTASWCRRVRKLKHKSRAPWNGLGSGYSGEKYIIILATEWSSKWFSFPIEALERRRRLFPLPFQSFIVLSNKEVMS